MMKLMFAIKALHEAPGGAERVLAAVAGGMAARGHEVSVLTFDGEREESFYPLAPGIKQHRLEAGEARGPSRLKDAAGRIRLIRGRLKSEKPDVVIPFMHSMMVPVAAARAGLGIRCVGSEHIVMDYYRGRKLQLLLFALASFSMEKMTVLSESIKSGYPFIIRRKMAPIPNPVTLAPPAGQERAPGGKTILSVGRLEERKNHAGLIEAFAVLAGDFPDWNLRIIGEGGKRKELETLARTLGLGARVSLPGTVREISQEYLKAGIFAMPSRFESFGLATAEAMVFGLPAVGFARCPGTNEIIIHGETGLLAGGGFDPRSLAEALRPLMSDEKLRLSLGGGARTLARRYEPEKILDAWEALLAGRPARSPCAGTSS